MLATRANLIFVQSRLAVSLAWVAGYVNASAVLTCGVVTSHVTGHASTLGKDVAERSWTDAAFMVALIGAFFAGAMVSGFALEFGRRRRWRSIYVLPAAIEVLLLAAFAVGVRMHDTVEFEVGGTLWWMTVVAAMAMGVQNATITRISSGVVRTTHLTGIVTDLGHETAQLVVSRLPAAPTARAADSESPRPSPDRLMLLASIILSFIVGSVCGAWIYFELPSLSMLAPILLLLWIIVAHLRTPTCDLEEAPLAEAMVAPRAGIAVFRAVARGGGTLAEAHLPDLKPLLERAGASRPTVIVDLSDARVFGALAAGAIHSLLSAAPRSGHRVILAGLDTRERATVNALSRAGLLSDANSAPTLAGALKLAETKAVVRSDPSGGT